MLLILGTLLSFEIRRDVFSPLLKMYVRLWWCKISKYLDMTDMSRMRRERRMADKTTAVGEA